MQFAVQEADLSEDVAQLMCNGCGLFVLEEPEPCVPTESICYPKDTTIASIRAKVSRDYQEV